MAKGSILTTISGKLGNSVFYKLTDSANKQTQGVRTYQPKVSNPKTVPQATQRMRMRPAINFYRGLQSLLDHSWQGVKYGSRSRAKFMEMALSPTLIGFPYVDKGETRFIPGEYPISIGSVPNPVTVNFEVLDNEHNANHTIAYFSLVNDTAYEASWGEASAELLTKYPFLQDGDELTFVLVFSDGQSYFPIHRYIVLDKASLATCQDIFTGAGMTYDNNGWVDVISGFDEEGPVSAFDDSWSQVAAGLIISRHPTKTSSAWMRSSSKLFIADSVKAQWMSDQRLLAARASYQNSANDLTSDWLLNQSENLGDAGALNPGTNYTVVSSSKTVGGVTANMAQLSVDGAAAKVILQSYAGSYYYGVLNNGTITFTLNQRITGNLGDTPYVDAAAAKAADRSHTYNLIADSSDIPVIEKP